MKQNNLSFKSENLLVNYFEFKFDVLSEHTKQKIVQPFFISFQRKKRLTGTYLIVLLSIDLI